MSRRSREPVITPWTKTREFTPTSFGSVTDPGIFSRRVGDSLEVRGYFKTGTTAVAAASIVLPAGLRIDSAKFSAIANVHLVGMHYFVRSGALDNNPNMRIVFYDGSTVDRVFFGERSTANAMTKENANSIVSADTDGMAFFFTVPIASWAAKK